MPIHSLSNNLAIEPSQLYVADVVKMRDFYAQSVGLDILESSTSRVLLGHGQTGIIELLAKPSLAHAGPRTAGLFHNAVLFSTRSGLSRAAGEVITQNPHAFSGTGDHLVSEAFYFNDPEGNGLELYYDRPQESWQWNDGRVVMDTLYIDPLGYIQQHASGDKSHTAKLGHVHLRIGDIDTARNFYVKLLGFDITAELPGALFVSVGGYHHHIGLNTWMSLGAGKRTPSLGLGDVTLELDTSSDVGTLAARVEAAKYPFTYANGALHLADPWGNTLTFIAK